MNTATAEQIKEWKDNYGDIFQISVEDKTCYLRKPSRKTLSYASQIGTKDPMKFNEIILKECWLFGDEDIHTDDSLFLAVSTQLDKVVEFKQAELVKL